MADLEHVREAVGHVLGRMDDMDPGDRAKIPDRDISAIITDLGVAFEGRFDSGELVDVREVDADEANRAAFRLHMSSDTLIDLIDERLSFAHGWTTGRIRVDAGWRDVLSLRRFL